MLVHQHGRGGSQLLHHREHVPLSIVLTAQQTTTRTQQNGRGPKRPRPFLILLVSLFPCVIPSEAVGPRIHLSLRERSTRYDASGESARASSSIAIARNSSGRAPCHPDAKSAEPRFHEAQKKMIRLY